MFSKEDIHSILTLIDNLYLNKSEEKNKYWLTEIELNNVQLEPLKYSDVLYPRAFFKSKDNDASYLGLGTNKILSNKFELNNIFNDLEDYPQLHVMGGQRFATGKETALEWQDFGDLFYFIPTFLFKETYQSKKLIIQQCSELPVDIKILKDQFLNLVEEVNNPSVKTHVSDDKIISSSGVRSITKNAWYSIIDTLVQILKEPEEDLNKVVVSQRHTTVVNNSSWKTLAHKLFENNQKNYNLIFSPNHQSHFLSSSPEKLFSLKNNTLTIDAIAGTASNANNDVESELNNQKNTNEHEWVKEFISKKLNELNIDHSWKERNQLMRLNEITHLYSKLEAKNVAPQLIYKILSNLHPTPAVAGFPLDKAIQVINAYETFDRGFYAGNFSVLNKSYFDTMVNIRSCLYHMNNLHFYAGCGIVPRSEPLEEWDEVQLKFQNLFKHFQTQELNPTKKDTDESIAPEIANSNVSPT